MENEGFFRKNAVLIHFPSIVLIIGYICFWTELYIIKSAPGKTSFLAYALLFLVLIFSLWQTFPKILVFFKNKYLEYNKYSVFEKLLYISGLLAILGICLIVLMALCYPPHLGQEGDALNYHMTLPRQHLILGSFKHIDWSAGDLFPFGIQFSLAPYYFLTDLPNKFIHLFFIPGLALASWSLIGKLECRNLFYKSMLVFALFGTHALAIQMPLAMFDIVFCYLFVAALNSFLDDRPYMAGIEFSFLFWGKSFFPLQYAVLFFLIAVVVLVARKMGYSIALGNMPYVIKTQIVKRFSVAFVVSSLFVGLPFAIKSLYYAGTPLYPFFTGFIQPALVDLESVYGQSIINASDLHLMTRNAYGYGRGILDFITHFWTLAVPERGVNNQFDYPLGLPYLLLLPVFFAGFIKKFFFDKQIEILSIMAVAMWAAWWLGSQQSRFLFIPLVLIYILALSFFKKRNIILMVTLLCALALTLLSVFRANYRVIGRSRISTVRSKDMSLINRGSLYYNNQERDRVDLHDREAAYANFPVNVISPLPNGDRWVLLSRQKSNDKGVK